MYLCAQTSCKPQVKAALKHIVVFASGSGTNFQSIVDAVEAGSIRACIRGLISNKPGIQALERAHRHGIDTKVIRPSDFESPTQYHEALLAVLAGWKTDLIILAGYLLKIPDAVVRCYPGRIINIHPSLLPKYGGKGYYGSKVHQAVIDNNEPYSGCTVHVVTEEYDEGPILAQTKVPVHASDDAQTLARRVLEQEHLLLPRVVGEMINKLNTQSQEN
jgi:formyltetrahydrofolate-dependent phosphoribosylglycinamide formyltransferase